MDSTSEPNWLTTRELAERWRLSARTLERWRVKRYGPVWHHIGGSIRYAVNEVEAFEVRAQSGGRA